MTIKQSTIKKNKVIEHLTNIQPIGLLIRTNGLSVLDTNMIKNLANKNHAKTYVSKNSLAKIVWKNRNPQQYNTINELLKFQTMFIFAKDIADASGSLSALPKKVKNKIKVLCLFDANHLFTDEKIINNMMTISSKTQIIQNTLGAMMGVLYTLSHVLKTIATKAE